MQPKVTVPWTQPCGQNEPRLTRAAVDAAYRQHAIDHGNANLQVPGRTAAATQAGPAFEEPDAPTRDRTSDFYAVPQMVG
jgi:hypothetical protein